MQARLSFVASLRILFSVVYALFACMAGLDKTSEEQNVLMVLGVHKSIVPLLVPCFCLRLPQKRNIITQGLATLVALLGSLVHSYQSVADPVVMGALNEVRATNHILSSLLSIFYSLCCTIQDTVMVGMACVTHCTCEKQCVQLLP